VDPDGPIGVIAGGQGAGRLVAGRLRRLIPREDVLVTSDEGWAPWARRPGRVVGERCLALGRDLAERGAKLVLVASLQGTLDGLAALRGELAVPVLGFELDVLVMQTAAAVKGAPVAVVVEHGSVRDAQLIAALKLVRSGGLQVVRLGEQLPDVGGLALASAGACLRPPQPPPGVTTISAVDLAVARAHRALVRSRLLAHRKRAGRVLAMSSHPTRA